MSKYKVGDVVVTRSDLCPSERYGKERLVFVGDMSKYRGMVCEISEVYKVFNSGDTWYHLKNAPCIWCDDMFEDFAEDEPFVTVVLPDTAEFNDRLRAGADFFDMFTYE